LKFSGKLQTNVLQYKISLRNLNAGIYTVVCVVGDQKLSAKFMIEEQ